MAERSKGTRLSRWSERKLDAKTKEPAQAQALTPTPETGDGAPDEMPELPDIDTLDKDSDFSMFMDARVPEELQRLALRKLWSSDPVYANLDGLNDYDPGHMKFLEQVSETAQRLINEALNRKDAEAGEAGGDAGIADAERGAESPASAEAANALPDSHGGDAPVTDRPHGPAEYADVEDMDDPDDVERG